MTLRVRLRNQRMLTRSMDGEALKLGSEEEGGGAESVAKVESCCDIWVRIWLVVSLEFLIRYL